MGDMRAAFKFIDLDGDGRLSREEIVSRLDDLRRRHPQAFENIKSTADASNKSQTIELFEA